VPTVEEIVRAMRMHGVEPEFPSDRQTAAPDVSPSTGPSDELISELERALRRAQRAPRPVWPGNLGPRNKLQEWVQSEGRKHVRGSRRSAIREVISDLLKEGYLETEPPEEEVTEVLSKMAREKVEARARNHERVWRGRR
jgi:hypothetical protein